MALPVPTLPRATYRLQFSANFTFDDATGLVDYLETLGISHVYASPYLKARPGSTHGYDIVDHHSINPEIGDSESFSRFTSALADHGMGQILDFVPNHMGIGRAENRWFLDVLTWGEESPFAEYFDIDWRPAKPELHGKLLVPILGDNYGAVLTGGELKLTIDESEDGFSIWYYEHRLPVTPGTYGRIVRPAIERSLQTDNSDDERAARLSLFAAGFDELRRHARSRSARTTRMALAERLKNDLATLIRTDAGFRQHLEQVITEFNGNVEQPESFRLLHQLLEAQAYRLAYWRVAAEEINYRRFFQINDLAGIRVEVRPVFDSIHRLVFQWLDEGRLHGLRIDHVDGLFEPRQYLERLQQRYRSMQASKPNGNEEHRDLYIVVEKIVAAHESLPSEWPIAGTTGYDFLNRVNGLFVDGSAEETLSAGYEIFTGQNISFPEITYLGRKLAMEQELASELRVLANEINHLTESNWFTRDYTLVGLRQALREIVACFPVYRTYIDWQHVRPEDRRFIDWAVAHGRRRSERSDLSVFDFLHELLTTDLANETSPQLNRREVRRLAMKFQQYTGPVMAKGVEDTAFYLYNRLISLNEVGGDPRQFGTSVTAFHRANQDMAKYWPATMLATATHDTKRGEDVRARINVLSELPNEWLENVQRWSVQNRRHKSEVNGVAAPDANDEYLFYQSLIGAWPPELMTEETVHGDALDPLRQRMVEFMLKTVREAKVHSSWINQNAEYEQALATFVERALDIRGRNPFIDSIVPFARQVAMVGVVNSLSQTTLKLTSPGVADIYQGCELWDLSLVDPDNRRPVDFTQRMSLLSALRDDVHAGEARNRSTHLLNDWPSGGIKLLITWRLLELRRRIPSLFESGSYRPLSCEGPRGDNLCAFLRTNGSSSFLVVVPRLIAPWTLSPDVWPIGASLWEGTSIVVPPAESINGLKNVITDETLDAGTIADNDGGSHLDVGKLLATFPVGVWA